MEGEARGPPSRALAVAAALLLLAAPGAEAEVGARDVEPQRRGEDGVLRVRAARLSGPQAPDSS